MKYLFIFLIGCSSPSEDCDFNNELLLAALINSEADTTDLEDMYLVGSTVLNRVDHHSFPCDIYGVIFDKTQFYGARTKRFIPTQTTIRAVVNLKRDTQVLYFVRKGIKFNKKFVRSSSVHNFYK